jgi:rSAM/selenodomain-associated transferase 2
MPVRGEISVVIPTLDEEGWVGEAVASVRDEAEVIVVDGGSRDRTSRIAAAEGARVLCAPASRGLQLDVGARAAAGDWLLFLHADTRLESGWAAALRALPNPVCGGAFRFAVDSPRRGYRWLEAGVALRCRLLGLPYGDQGIFTRREVYRSIGGIAPLPLMEDVDFVRRVARTGRFELLPQRAFTSPRRWERDGLLLTTLTNWLLLGLYTAGWPPARLAGWYRRPGG